MVALAPGALAEAPPEAARDTAPVVGVVSTPMDGGTETSDALPEAGYLPGYRGYASLGMGPYAPQAGALPGGVTTPYRAPMPAGEWTLRFTGYLSASAQFSTNQRLQTSDGQSSTVFHAPPATLDEYGSFVSTNNVPGHWVQMYFDYGNRDVTATVQLSTWNPSEPATYYQLGSQNFINSAYLTYSVPTLAQKLRIAIRAGYFYSHYGQLGEYNLGMYQNPIAAIIKGVGGTITVGRDVTATNRLFVEAGFMGNRNGKAPTGLTRQSPNYNTDPTLPASYVGHVHAGLEHRGRTTTVKVQLHAIVNWSQDERTQYPVDNMVTRGLDESYVRDGRMRIVAGDVTLSHPGFGRLAAGAAHVSGSFAYTLRGVQSFAGEGQPLTERWLGNETGGTGTVNVAGFNYTGSLRKLLAYPGSADAARPDVVINAGAIVARSHSANPLFDGRMRAKGGLDVACMFVSWMGAGLRVDRVVPNAKDAQETFHVIAPRLVWKTGWTSRENISLVYARWFYGAHSHAESSAVLPPRPDNQLLSLNVNLWW